MDTINCKICGRLFYYQTGAPLCPKCTSILDEKFDRVKEYLYENPGATMQNVSEVNDVSVQQIRKWVREERLEFTADSIIGVDCEICGTLIKTGRFCKGCKDALALRLGKAFNQPIPEEIKNELKEKSAIRFLNNINNK
jgi:hypothetical protein